MFPPICDGIWTWRRRVTGAQLMYGISCYSDFCQEFPCFACRDVDDRTIGSICSHCLYFPAGFLCGEILLRSTGCLLLLFHKVLNASAYKDRLGGSILQESALLQLASVQPQFSQNAEKNMSTAHMGYPKPFEGLQTVPVLLGFHWGSLLWVLEYFTPNLLRTLLRDSQRHWWTRGIKLFLRSVERSPRKAACM